MAALICNFFLNTSDHSKDGFIFFFDPQNIDVHPYCAVNCDIDRDTTTYTFFGNGGSN